MRTANILFNIIVIAISGFFFNKSLSFPEGPGDNGIGPAFFPQIILICLILFSVIDLIKIFFQQEITRFFEGITRQNAVTFSVVVVCMTLMIFFLGKLPFILIAASMIFLQCLILKMKILHSISTAVVLSISVYLIFVKGFSILL